MERVGIREMRQHLSRFAQRARTGESFRGHGRLPDVIDELPEPLPGPPSSTVLDELRAESGRHPRSP